MLNLQLADFETVILSPQAIFLLAFGWRVAAHRGASRHIAAYGGKPPLLAGLGAAGWQPVPWRVGRADAAAGVAGRGGPGARCWPLPNLY